MTLEKVSDYVTCGELIDRLGCLTIEFVKGIRRGIVPKPTSEAGGFRTAETDPAFYDHSLMPSVDEWVKYVRAAKIFRFFAESSWPRMRHELGHCWKVVETDTTTEPDHDQQVDGYSRPLPGDKITDFIQRLHDKKVHPDEIQYRTYEYGLPEWDVTQWQVNCLVRNKAYPPEGLMGEVERNNHGKAYGRAKLRYLAKVETSEKSEKVPEQSEFMA